MSYSIAETRVNNASRQSGVVFDMKRFAIHDGPGIRTTIFFKGCPLRCEWCHNPESQRSVPEILFRHDDCVDCGTCVSACPVGAIHPTGGAPITDRERCSGCGTCVDACPKQARTLIGSQQTVDSLMAVVEADSLFYEQSGGGVTLSGGEPLAQPDVSTEILLRCKKLRIHTAVDTCGYADPAALEQVANSTDLFLYDIKLLDDRRHTELTGVSNGLILENLARLSSWGARTWIRYPLIPGANDRYEDLEALGRLVAHYRNIESIQLLPYHRGGERKRRSLDWPSPAHDFVVPSDVQQRRAMECVQSLVDKPVTLGG